MTAVRGIADLSFATRFDDGTLLRAGDEPAHFVHLPATLEIAATESGEPDFSLEFVRSEDAGRPPAPYGVLDLRLAAPVPARATLGVARALHPGAFVTPAIFAGGHVRLLVVAGRELAGEALAAELERPLAVVSDGLTSTRVIKLLSPELATLLRDVLVEGGLTLTAVAELDLPALTERVPVTVAFERRALIDALATITDAHGQLAVDDIVALWERPDGVALLRSDGLADADRSRVARILADWTVDRFAVPVACARRDVVPTVRLELPEAAEDELTWDLMHAHTTTRIAVLRLDALVAARRLVAAAGIDRLVRRTTVPPIDDGILQIEVDANLPQPIRGVAKTGVRLRAAANPPDRVHELSAVLLFEGHRPRQRVGWRMSPSEPLRYEYATFALLHDGEGPRRVDGPAIATEDRHLLLGVDDLPVDLVAIAAGEELLDAAVVRGACVRDARAGGAPAHRIAFELSELQPRVALALVAGSAADYRIELEACPHDGSSCVALAPRPARGEKVDVSSFPGFGDHAVAIDVAFDDRTPFVAIDVRAERDGEDGTPAVLAFTPARPSREWRYFNPTPFRSGYRFRPHDGVHPWSAVRAAGAPLRLRTSQLAVEPPVQPVNP